MDLDPASLATLTAAVRLGSLDAAARELNLTPSAVSQRIRSLEGRVGRVLLQRSRPVRATGAGEVLVRLTSQVQLLQAEALTELQADPEPPGRRQRLAVAVNADSLATWLLPAVAEVQQSHHVVLELVRDDEQHSADLLRQGRVIGAVTAEPRPVQGCRTVPLGVLRYRAVASPDWHRRWGTRWPEQLEQAPMLVFDDRDTLQHRLLAHRGWPDADPPTTSVPSSADFDRAARMGIGWGLLPEPAIGAALATGELQEVWPDGTTDVPLYWQHWRLGSATVAAVTAAVRRAAAAVLLAVGSR